MLTLLNKKLNLYFIKNITNNNNNENFKNKHYVAANLEWFNNVYYYNNKNKKLLPISDKIVLNLIKIYFSLTFKTNSNRAGLRLKRFSTNKIFFSNTSIKHTNNKVIISVYIYNREIFYILKKIESLHKILKTKYEKLNLNNVYLHNFKLENLTLNKKVENENKKILNNTNLNNYLFNYENLHNKILKMELLYVHYYKLLLQNSYKLKDFNLFYLKNLISRVYNKKIQLNIIHVKQLYLNSDIFIESMAIKLKNRKNKLLKVFKKALKLVKLPFFNKYNTNKTLFVKDNNSLKNKDYLNINYLPLNLNNIFNSIKYKSINGIRIEASGRLTKRLTASRSVFKSKHKGSIKNIDSSFKGLSCIMLRGNNKPNMQFSKINSKTRNGSFGLKG